VIQKYTLGGELLWIVDVQSAADTSFTPVSLALINDTSLLMTGYREHDYPQPGDDVVNTVSIPFARLYNTEGQLLWTRQFDPHTQLSYFDHGIVSNADAGFLFGHNDLFDPCLIKLTPANVVQVHSNIALTGAVGKVGITADGQFLIGAANGYRITQISPAGTPAWSTYYGTNLPSNTSGDQIRSIVQDTGGNSIVSGRHYGEDWGTDAYTNADILTVKYDPAGVLLWQNRYEFNLDNADIGNFVKLKNGFVYVGGASERLGVATDYDYVVLKINAATGETAGIYRYDGPANGDDAVSALGVLDDGHIALTGSSYNGSSYQWTTQLLSDAILSIADNTALHPMRIYPDPADDELTVDMGHSLSAGVRIVIRDMAGRYVLQTRSTSSSISINVGRLGQGVYSMQVIDVGTGAITTGRFVVAHR
jgi:hypothetical protein